MFNNPWLESITNVIDLSAHKERFVLRMLEHIYRDETEIDETSAQELLALAHCFQLDGLKKDVEFFLAKRVCFENALNTFKMAVTYESDNLASDVASYIHS